MFSRYTIPTDKNDIGSWTLEDVNYLGNNFDGDRTMHYSLILPTKQILIINGGNYQYIKGVTWPLLLTPIYDGDKTNGNCVFTGNYTRKRMVASLEERVYHNGACLMQDGRILSYGGNGAYGLIDIPASQDKVYPNSSYSKVGQKTPNLERVTQTTWWGLNDQSMFGLHGVMAENWIMEVFSPPYIFIDDTRVPVLTDLCSLNNYDYTCKETGMDGSTYYLMHSNETYQIPLTNLPSSCPAVIECTSNSIVLIKLASPTHSWDSGQKLHNIEFEFMDANTISFTAPNALDDQIVPAYYHMFFVDCVGKPSESLMVRFDDKATSPF